MDDRIITAIGPTRPNTVFPLTTDQPAKVEPGFGDMLKSAVNSVNSQLTDADDKLVKLATGEIKDPHEVMLALQKADLSLSLVLEIRDRALEAYQTIMRLAL